MKTLNLNNLQNAEHLSFIGNLLELLNEANIPSLSELQNKLAKQVSLEAAAQKEVIKSNKTNNLRILDKNRDDILRGLILRVKSEVLTPNIERKEAAKIIKIVINKYGNFGSHNYQSQTVEIKGLVRKLRTEKYIQAVTTIGLTEWLDWLEQENYKFEEVYIARRNEYAKRPKYNLKKIRKETDLVFKDIRKIINALQLFQPSEQLTILIAKANVTINHWREILNKRKAG